jgi:hypothetical protein
MDARDEGCSAFIPPFNSNCSSLKIKMAEVLGRNV